MLGIIGAGRWGTNYLRTLLQLKEEVKWLYSRSEKSLEKAVKEARAENVKTTADYSKILSDRSVKAVAIATAASAHHETAKKALEAGKHVLVEKPMTLSSKDAAELVELAQKKKEILMAGHLHRYNPGIQKLKELIDDGSIGKITKIRITTTSSGPVREDVSALWDMLPHDITITAYLLGGYPEAVQATGKEQLKKGRIDTVTAAMEFPGRIIAESLASWAGEKKQRIVEVTGEKGKARYDDYGKKLELQAKGKENEISFDTTPPLTIELKHFLNCVKHGNKPLSDGKEGLKNVKVLEAMEESIRKGRRVELGKL